VNHAKILYVVYGVVSRNRLKFLAATSPEHFRSQKLPHDFRDFAILFADNFRTEQDVVSRKMR